MFRLAGGLFLPAALLLGGAPSIELGHEDGRTVWIAAGCLEPGRLPADAFSVYVDGLEDAPPLAGDYRARGSDIIFEPRYRPSPGVSYRAECKLNAGPPATALYTIPAEDRTPTTEVTQVYPTADNLPENLLKFYIHFSAPMSRGYAYEHVRLLDDGGSPVELPFLEIDEELWDANYQRLTLLFDPGRIKSGLVPNQEVGIALQAGRTYTLAIDSGWLDAEGKPLRRAFEKRFTAEPADTDPPDPKSWTLTAPSSGVDALVLDFPEPLDQALLSRVLAVRTRAGHPVAGRSAISRGETRWSFVPDAPWKPGRYRIEAMTILEDLAGNSINRPFEVDVFEKVQQRVARETVSVPFNVGPD